MARWFRDRSARHGIPSVRLRSLLPEARFVGCRDLEVSGCSADSRRLEPGEVFVALRDEQRDGHEFTVDALQRGAVGVIVERLCPEAGPIQIIVPDAREAYARICQALAEEPSRELLVYAVAGPDAAVTALFLRSIFESGNQRVGLVAPANWFDGRQSYPRSEGLDAAVLAAMLAAMVENQCGIAIVALTPDDIRAGADLAGVALDSVILTGTGAGRTADPIASRGGPRRLLRRLKPEGALLINADDPEAFLLGAGASLETPLVTFGIDRQADLRGTLQRLDSEGTRLVLRGEAVKPFRVVLPVVGRAHAASAVAATALAVRFGMDCETIRAGLAAVDRIPGRLEPIRAGQPFPVLLDETRTAAPLRDVRSWHPGRLIAVLDRSNPPGASRRLEAECKALADVLIVIPDDPSWVEGVEQGLQQAQAGDCLVVLGSGRRPIVGGTVRSDRTLVELAVRRHLGRSARRSA